jgi:hypothetical protein
MKAITHLRFVQAEDTPVQPTKTPSNGRPKSTVLATIQAPKVEVRDNVGGLVATIEQAQATDLLTRGWAEPVGNKNVKYLRLTHKAPLHKIRDGGWLRRTGKTTQPVRGDQTCLDFAAGQLMGDARSHQEHKPVSDPILYQAWRTALRPK